MHLIRNDLFSAFSEHQAAPLVVFVAYLQLTTERVSLIDVQLDYQELVHNI